MNKRMGRKKERKRIEKLAEIPRKQKAKTITIQRRIAKMTNTVQHKQTNKAELELIGKIYCQKTLQQQSAEIKLIICMQ